MIQPIWDDHVVLRPGRPDGAAQDADPPVGRQRLRDLIRGNFRVVLRHATSATWFTYVSYM